MKEREMALNNLILEARVGSHLYGTSMPDSDEDKVGIFIPNEEYILGFKRVEQVDFSKKSKDKSGKNTSEAEDRTVYTLDKFIRLALDNNPNILEILFVNDENLLFANDIGRELISLRYDFLSKNIKHRFLGYAFSQKKKMVIKMENREAIKEAIDFLENSKSIIYLNDIQHHPLFQRKKDIIKVGDVKLNATVTRKKAIKMLQARVETFSHRKELVSKYGHDVKFSSHLIRLLAEGIELLETGDLKFPLKRRHMLRDIRKGKYKLNDILALADMLENYVESLYEKTDLPKKPNIPKVEEFLVKTYRGVICGH